MAIGFRTVTTTSGNQTTGFTLVISSTVVANDLLILCVTNRDATADPGVTDNDTGGNTWAKIANQNAATNGAGTIWWKRATSATASKTITVSGCTGSASGCLVPVTGASLGTVPYGTAVGEANASGNVTQVGITVGRAGSHVCLSVHCTSNDTLNPDSFTATDPSSLAERAEGQSTGGSDCSVSFATAEKTTAGATGNISWLQTAGTGASIAFELKATVSLACDSGTFNITGTAANLIYPRVLSAASGSFVITGTAATLTYVPAATPFSQLATVSTAGATNDACTTSPAIDTTGAKLIVVSKSWWNNSEPPLTDSASNTWVPLTHAQDTYSGAGLFRNRLEYCINPTTSATHTFSAAATDTAPTLSVTAWAATAPSIDQQASIGGHAVSSLQASTITPTNANSLVVSGVAGFQATGFGINGGFSATATSSLGGYAGGIGGGIATLLQTSAAAAAPTWSWTNPTRCGVTICSFSDTPAGTTYTLVCDSGAFVISGTAATLTYGGGGGAFTHIVSTIDADTINAVTTDAINTTGADLIVLSLSIYQSGSAPTPTDSEGNTWVPLTSRTSAVDTNYKVRLWYCIGPSTDASHTFSCIENNTACSLGVMAFSAGGSTVEFDQETGASGAYGATTEPASLTPSENDCLIITAVTHTQTGTAIDDGFTEIDIPVNGGDSMGGGIAYLIQTSAAAAAPTWTQDGASQNAGAMASFKLAGGGGGGGGVIDPLSGSLPGSATDPLRG